MGAPAPEPASIWRRHLPEWVGRLVAVFAIGAMASIGVFGGEPEARIWGAVFWIVIAAFVAAVVVGERLYRRLRGPRLVRVWCPEEWRAHDRKRARRLLSRVAVAAAFVAAYPATAGPAWYAVGRGWLPQAAVEVAYQPVWGAFRGTALRPWYRGYCDWWLRVGSAP